MMFVGINFVNYLLSLIEAMMETYGKMKLEFVWNLFMEISIYVL